MAKKRDEVTVRFDHHKSAKALNMDYAYAELRHRCPVAWTDSHDGYWVITKYEDVATVTRRHEAFSTGGGITIPPAPYGKTAMVDFDPPEHTAYRRALNATLSRDTVEQSLMPRIEHWTSVFIDRVIESGRTDLMADIAIAVPAAVTLEWLGWEQEDEWFKIGEAWHDLIGRALDDPRFELAAQVIVWFDQRVAEELEKRRADPRPDAMGHIATMEIHGQRLSDEEAVSLVRILVGAGVDTTTSLIGSALVHLHYNPEDRQRLVDEPELWGTATEEFLRRYTPARTVARTCVLETELEGCTLMPGDRVLASLSSANQDASVFNQPLEFNPTRTPNKHMSFGLGVHRCIGMHLARAEFVHVVREVLRRMPDYRVLDDQLVEYSRQSVVTGWMTAPAEFTPGYTEA